MLAKTVLQMGAALIFLSGCASYRTDSNMSFDSINVGKRPNKVIITTAGFPDKKFKELGAVEAEVKKLTLFHSDPTKEQVDIVLEKNAVAMGADAVINVVYKTGVGMTTWGYIEAKGMGIKFTE